MLFARSIVASLQSPFNVGQTTGISSSLGGLTSDDRSIVFSLVVERASHQKIARGQGRQSGKDADGLRKQQQTQKRKRPSLASPKCIKCNSPVSSNLIRTHPFAPATPAQLVSSKQSLLHSNFIMSTSRFLAGAVLVAGAVASPHDIFAREKACNRDNLLRCVVDTRYSAQASAFCAELTPFTTTVATVTATE
jgi:hypothetical protein